MTQQLNRERQVSRGRGPQKTGGYTQKKGNLILEEGKSVGPWWKKDLRTDAIARPGVVRLLKAGTWGESVEKKKEASP